jgi:hypothetical protein
MTPIIFDKQLLLVVWQTTGVDIVVVFATLAFSVVRTKDAVGSDECGSDAMNMDVSEPEVEYNRIDDQIVTN